MNKFIITKQYKQFTEFCRACHRDQYIGLCYGPAGAGKTASVINYTNWNKITKKSKGNYLASQPTPAFSMSRWHSIPYTPQILASPRDVIYDIKELQQQFSQLKEWSLYPDGIPSHVREESHNYAELVIIDEAERLKSQSFELIRELYDAGKTNFIFVGMPGLEKIIERFPQLYSRVGFVHQFKNLGRREVEFIIAKHFSKLGVNIDEGAFSDQEAVSTIIRMTNGNFRLINRLLKQSQRIMQVNCMTALTTEIIEAARKCLLIGEN